MNYPNEDLSRWAQGRTRNMHPDTAALLAGPPKIERPTSATYWTRCAEMATWIVSYVGDASRGLYRDVEIDQVGVWVDYIMGETNERPA